MLGSKITHSCMDTLITRAYIELLFIHNRNIPTRILYIDDCDDDGDDSDAELTLHVYRKQGIIKSREDKMRFNNDANANYIGQGRCCPRI